MSNSDVKPKSGEETTHYTTIIILITSQIDMSENIPLSLERQIVSKLGRELSRRE